jgi:hypothetical protein
MTRPLDISVVETAGKRRVLNCLPSPRPETDWRIEHADAAGLVAPKPAAAAAAAAAIPTRKDLRAKWWPVGDQGETGSCVGWACTDGVLRWHFVDAGRLGRNEMLSPRFQWMAAKEVDQDTSQPTTFIETAGTWLKAALDVSRKYGAVPLDMLPFDPDLLYDGEVPTFYAKASELRISSYFNLGTRIDDWRRWLATKGPILTRLDVDDTWYDATQNKGRLDAYKPPASPAGHAVVLVGYTARTFIVRNSWGAGWGDKGFGHASLSYAEEAFTECYGVSI